MILILIFSGLLSGGFGVLAKNSSNTAIITDPVNYLLTKNDLLPLCEWQQAPIVTRLVADGSLTFTEFSCGKDPNMRRVFQMVLVTAREFQPGDGNYYISLRDIGANDALVNIGNWATNMRTMYDQSAITFTKQNVLVYIADGGGYSQEDIYNLAEISAGRIPDQIVSVLTPSVYAGQTVDQSFLENISVMPPTLIFANMGEDMPAMSRLSNNALGQLNFSAQFTEPRQVVVEIYAQDTENFLARWILPLSNQPVYALDKLLKPSPIVDVDYANDLFFGKGTYIVLVTIEGKVINRTEFIID